MDQVDFADLLARVKAGDEEATRDLLHRFEDDVRTMVRVRLPRALRSQFDSMDFVQAVWQSVLTGPNPDLDRFANVQHFRGFLSGVARNKVLEEHRRRTRTRKYDLRRQEPLYIRRGDRDVPREVATPDPTPSQDVQAQDRLRQMVEGRSPQEAEIVELRRSGMTFEEIAERTGLHERAVRRVIEAIRQRLEARQWQ
jgi:RNA polymerase sigma-70 factor (ECF subfamily)